MAEIIDVPENAVTDEVPVLTDAVSARARLEGLDLSGAPAFEELGELRPSRRIRVYRQVQEIVKLVPEDTSTADLIEVERALEKAEDVVLGMAENEGEMISFITSHEDPFGCVFALLMQLSESLGNS